ncbi:MAG: protein kinase domain-containing protein [Bradymonadia bacterium]
MMESLLETPIGDYVLKSLISTGGMAAVFEAEHHTDRTRVAVKVLKRTLARRRDPLARMMQEGRVICSLHNEHIVRVYDYGAAEENLAYIVMERLDGDTLAVALAKDRQFAPGRAAFIGAQMCQGLACAHARGVFHRDIKPGNVMLVQDQRHRDFVKLLDFGIAKLDADDPSKLAATATGMTLGTPEYMSPEQAMAGDIDARSDIYQLGLLLYEMVVGEPPFMGANPVKVMQAHLRGRPVPVRHRRHDVPEDLEQVIMRCIARKPEDRYSSCTELGEILDGLAVHDTSGAGVKTLMKTARATGPLLADLQLPSLGRKADMARYARNVAASIEELWRPEERPEALAQLQHHIEVLTEDRDRMKVALEDARAEADVLATTLEGRLRPLEHAISILQGDVDQIEQEAEDDGRHIAALEDQIGDLDAEYARLYHQLESHQATLYATASRRPGSIIEFGDLFQEDIDNALSQMEHLFRERAEVAGALERRRSSESGRRQRLADVQLQICELHKSRLGLKAERTTALSAKERAVEALESRLRAVERAIEHRHLQLGIALRRAVSQRLG